MSKGEVLDQELAAVKIDGDVDEVSRELLRLLGVAEPPAYEPSRDPFAAQATHMCTLMRGLAPTRYPSRLPRHSTCTIAHA